MANMPAVIALFWMSWICQLISRCYCFNMDAAFPLRIPVPNGLTGSSSFGFSSGFYFHKRNQAPTDDLLAGNRGLLVGAPTATDLSNTATVRPGLVFFCRIDSFDRPKRCQQLTVDNDSTPQVAAVGSYPYRDNSLLGFTIAIQDAQPFDAMACAPLWTNGTFLPNSRNTQPFYAPSGMCYRVPKDSTSEIPSIQWQKLRFPTGNSTRFIPGSTSTTHLYSFSHTGFTAEYDTGNSVILGAPGYLDGTGTVAHVSLTGGMGVRNAAPSLLSSDPVQSEIGREQRGYLGYAVASGMLFNDNTRYYASGMPQARSAGIVVVYRPLTRSTRLQRSNVLDIKFFLKGNQLFEGFGQSVLMIDINKDKRLDFIVGAPNAYDSSGEVDQGVVYIFLNPGDAWKSAKPKQYFNTSIVLTGLDGRGARFGVSLVALVDINNDGFNDFAVGSPFGDGGGSVYVYYGDVNGINPKLTQRIRSSGNNRGFSWSLSSANGKQSAFGRTGGYLAVGDFMNENVQVFRTHSVANWTFSLSINETKLSLNAPGDRYLLATVCIQTNWTLLTPARTSRNYILKGRLELDRNLPDSLLIQPRAIFQSSRSTVANVSIPFQYRIGVKSVSECHYGSSITVLDPSSWPYEIGRVPMSFHFRLDEFSTNEPQKYCEDCVTVSPDSVTNASNSVTFSWCDEPSGNCRPVIALSTMDSSVNISVKTNDTFALRYDIFNEATSYIVRSPMLELTLPFGVAFDRLEVKSSSDSFEMKMDCKDRFAASSDNITGSHHVMCRTVNMGSVIYPDQQITMTAIFTTARMNLALDEMPGANPNIVASFGHRYLQNGTEEIIWEPSVSTSLIVMTTLRLSANNAKTTLEIKPDAHDNVISNSVETKFNLSFEVINMGPGILPDKKARVTINIPITYQNVSVSRLTFLQIDNETGHFPCLTNSDKNTSTTTPTKGLSDLSISYTATELNEKPIRKATFKMDCLDEFTSCHQYTCYLPTIGRNEKVNITAGLEISRESFTVEDNRQTLFEILVSSSVILYHDVSSEEVHFHIADEKSLNALASVRIKTLFTFSGLPWYIILAAGAGSFVVLVLIAVILVKSGFFRRKPLVLEEPIYEEHVIFDNDDILDVDKSTSSLVPVEKPVKVLPETNAGNRSSLL
ncbi:integrin alpha-4-like [Paramacrobiotus metropolitanus]|uniref:integrin alpha-4-like n=1 Tax=Paramacrobiotus metropolitanus TaxID=2943436 RepID=UPI0024457105|nr:integrin alpha-4-like [Paramacrobiotus metropolitanus]